ncbi:MAG: von Willebrand factor type A domain-containing protein [Bacteroidales bacterium]|jgi:Ca-activated chloride channel family protein|nr:von Willebrand factor type A domain-containing protein [Bacteroidales bacterium]
MKKNVILISILTVLLNCGLSARTIKGTVISLDDSKAIAGASIILKSNPGIGTTTDNKGNYSIQAVNTDILVFSFVGMKTEEVNVGNKTIINVALESDALFLVVDDIEIAECEELKYDKSRPMVSSYRVRGKKMHAEYSTTAFYLPAEDFNREGYSAIHENGYKDAIKTPLSTFSIDVDAASYSNMRRFLNNGQKPPTDAVRIEEMINYFNYDYPQPDNGHPFAIVQELANCPWNNESMLLHIGLQGEKIAMDNLPASNIVFLIDVSGSMSSPDKLPLLKKAFKMLVQQLREEDRVAIVVYAGSSGLVLPSTSGSKKQTIVNSLDKLQSGGSTAGAAGLKLAYQVASENFIEDGNNRIILATDGDFNVGQSSNAEMERLIEKERERGTFISVLGFGTGNYMDDKMEIIADKGNGNYAYIDNIMEAKKVLVNEFGGTLFTIAKDVKIQIEFNPQVVESYRLIGYENRLLNDEDFADDKKDAGELGSGHTVTALYEIKLANTSTLKKNDLKYQTTKLNTLAKEGDELATVKFRYKKPKEITSILLEEVIPYRNNYANDMSDNFRFSAAVAGFGLLLRDSQYKGNITHKSLINLAITAKGKDAEGYRSEFIQLIKLAEQL